jgi:hypothetical protein
MPKRRCFVISPIGAEGSDVREHADDVFEFIVKPALDELQIDGYRADHFAKIGKITEQMFESILGEDLCIAILTGHNPNVFYELAIAHAAARPVIILVEKGTTIPFDIRDMRAVEYDLKPKALRDRVYSGQIVQKVRHLEGDNWTVPVPFGSNLSPLGSGRGDWQFFAKSAQFGDPGSWLGFLERSQKSFDLCGISLHSWTRHSGAKRTIEAAIARGVKIRILMLHPDNPAIPLFINAKETLADVEHVRSMIKLSHSNFSKLLVNAGHCEVRCVKGGAMHQQLIITDTEAAAIFYLYSITTSESPMLYCPATGPLYQSLCAEFASLWEAGEPLTAP